MEVAEGVLTLMVSVTTRGLGSPAAVGPLLVLAAMPSGGEIEGEKKTCLGGCQLCGLGSGWRGGRNRPLAAMKEVVTAGLMGFVAEGCVVVEGSRGFPRVAVLLACHVTTEMARVGGGSA